MKPHPDGFLFAGIGIAANLPHLIIYIINTSFTD